MCIRDRIKLYERQSEIQSLSGNYPGALENYKLYAISKDSVFNMEKDKKLTEATMQYEFDKKEAKARAEQEQKDIRQRAIRYSILAGLIGALIFAGVVYRQRIKIGQEKDVYKRQIQHTSHQLWKMLEKIQGLGLFIFQDILLNRIHAIENEVWIHLRIECCQLGFRDLLVKLRC